LLLSNIAARLTGIGKTSILVKEWIHTPLVI
jgi:hypothetical protein